MRERYMFLTPDRITTGLSLAVSLRDGFTGREETVGGVRVSVSEPRLEPVVNPSGYHNFLDLPEGVYALEVKSTYYLNEKVDVGIPFYKTRPGFLHYHASGTHLKKMLPSASVAARVGSPGPSAGDNSILLRDISNPIAVGDVFIVEDEERTEFFKVKAPLPGDPVSDPFNITLPLRFDHGTGVPLRKISPGPSHFAEIDGGVGVPAGGGSVSLTSLTGKVNINDVFKTEGGAPEFFQTSLPLLELDLKPNCLYPFPYGTTLIRGAVKDSSGGPVAGASVEIIGGTVKTVTSENGGFVLYFPPDRGGGTVSIRGKKGSRTRIENGVIKRGQTTTLTIVLP